MHAANGACGMNYALAATALNVSERAANPRAARTAHDEDSERTRVNTGLRGHGSFTVKAARFAQK
jgi:hypothetical protein